MNKFLMFSVSVLLIIIGQRFLGVPTPETFLEFVLQTVGTVLICLSAIIPWNK